MLALIMAATLGGGCAVQAGYGYQPAYGYARTYVSYGYTPAYSTYQAPVQAYQAPQVDYKAVVGEYLREEYRQKAEQEQAARLARIEALLAQPRVQAPVQQFQAPPPQYQPVQVPSKASPQSPSFSTPQYPPPVFQQPPSPEKNSPSAFGGAQPPPLARPPSAGGDITAVSQILANRCAACHQAPASRGAGIVLLDPNGNLAPMSPALMLAIQEDIKTGKMPKGGPQLPDNELAEVSGWVGDHSAEVAAFLAQGLGR
jgi:mono/diheme cytochrome c family protein